MSLIRDDDPQAFIAGILLILAVACGVAAVTTQRLSVVVERGHIHQAPAWIRLRVRVAPDPANRTLILRAESPDGFARRSDESLEGSRAAKTRWVEWGDVPAGTYTVQATVERGAERPWRASAGFIVLGRGLSSP